MPRHQQEALQRGESARFNGRTWTRKDIPELSRLGHFGGSPQADVEGAPKSGAAAEEFEAQKARADAAEAKVKEWEDAADAGGGDPRVTELLTALVPEDEKKLDNFSVDQLRAIAKYRGHDDSEHLNKAEAIKFLLKQ